MEKIDTKYIVTINGIIIKDSIIKVNIIYTEVKKINNIYHF